MAPGIFASAPTLQLVCLAGPLLLDHDKLGGLGLLPGAAENVEVGTNRVEGVVGGGQLN